VAQNTQPIAQPACELMQAVTRPVKRMSTVSIRRSSARREEVFAGETVAAVESVASGSAVNASSVSSALARKRAGSSGISAQWSTHAPDRGRPTAARHAPG
jgi:hypothetical protein